MTDFQDLYYCNDLEAEGATDAFEGLAPSSNDASYLCGYYRIIFKLIPTVRIETGDEF